MQDADIFSNSPPHLQCTIYQSVNHCVTSQLFVVFKYLLLYYSPVPSYEIGIHKYKHPVIEYIYIYLAQVHSGSFWLPSAQGSDATGFGGENDIKAPCPWKWSGGWILIGWIISWYLMCVIPHHRIEWYVWDSITGSVAKSGFATAMLWNTGSPCGSCSGLGPSPHTLCLPRLGTRQLGFGSQKELRTRAPSGQQIIRPRIQSTRQWSWTQEDLQQDCALMRDHMVIYILK